MLKKGLRVCAMFGLMCFLCCFVLTPQEYEDAATFSRWEALSLSGGAVQVAKAGEVVVFRLYSKLFESGPIPTEDQESVGEVHVRFKVPEGTNFVPEQSYPGAFPGRGDGYHLGADGYVTMTRLGELGISGIEPAFRVKSYDEVMGVPNLVFEGSFTNYGTAGDTRTGTWSISLPISGELACKDLCVTLSTDGTDNNKVSPGSTYTLIIGLVSGQIPQDVDVTATLNSSSKVAKIGRKSVSGSGGKLKGQKASWSLGATRQANLGADITIATKKRLPSPTPKTISVTVVVKATYERGKVITKKKTLTVKLKK